MPAVAAPLEDENLLADILLRLAPLPSSLPRASLVCNRWRRLVSDRGFIRRFRAHHRRRIPPPLLGFFEKVTRSPTTPALSRVTPTASPSTQSWIPPRPPPCRALLHQLPGRRHPRQPRLPRRARAYDQPGTSRHRGPGVGPRHRRQAPLRRSPGARRQRWLNGAVLRTAGIHDDPVFQFQVVMVGVDKKNKRAFACVYSSGTGEWGDPVYASVADIPMTISMRVSSTLAENSLYWVLDGNTAGILEFDLDRQRLTMIPVPLKTCSDGSRSFRAMRAEGGGLGILELLDFSIQLWKRKTDCDGVASWVLMKTIESDRLLSLNKEQRRPVVMLGYCEDNNVVFLWTQFLVFSCLISSHSSPKNLPYNRFAVCFIHSQVSIFQT
ncbi:unnamed protein product [Alopecurus aequalis]